MAENKRPKELLMGLVVHSPKSEDERFKINGKSFNGGCGEQYLQPFSLSSESDLELMYSSLHCVASIITAHENPDQNDIDPRPLIREFAEFVLNSK